MIFNGVSRRTLMQEPDCFTVGQLVTAQAEALIPIMERYHVDVYDAGHVHSCKLVIPAK